MEVKGQELELQEKRMILNAVQGGVDSILKFGYEAQGQQIENAGLNKALM